MAGNEVAIKPAEVADALSTLLAAYYGARQLVRDLDRFPHAIADEERANIVLGTARLEGVLKSHVEQIGNVALSPRHAQELADAVGEGRENVWRHFFAHVHQLRDATARASRRLRLRKGTGEFVVGKESGERPAGPNALDRNAHLSLRRLNRKLLTLEMLAGVERPSSRPLRVLVDVTNKCNFRCRTCYQSNSQDFVYYDVARAPFENLQPFLDAAEVVNFAGTGEPLLSPDTPELIRLAAASGAETELVTNGSLFHRLTGLEERLSRVFLSFDGASAKTVDTIRKGAKFDNIIADLRAMPESFRRKICFNMVVCRPNVHEIAALARLSRELKVGALHLQAFHPYLPWHDAMALREEDAPLLAEQIAAARLELEGSGMTFNVTFPVDPAPARVRRHALPVADQDRILTQLNNVPTPPSQGSESWAALSGRFSEFTALELPSELLSSFDGATEAAESPPEVSSEAHFNARITELLSSLKASPSVRVPDCLAPHSLLYMVGDGAVRPCCILETRLGDLHAESARDVWHSSGAVGLRRGATGATDMPAGCNGCTDGGRFGFLHLLLLEAQGLGVDMTRVELPKGAPVPESVRQWLGEVRARASTDWSRAQGNLDVIHGHLVAGWAFHPDLNHPEAVEVFVDGNLVLSMAAMEFREDLRKAGVGDGRHGFTAYIPDHYVDGCIHEIQVRFTRTGTHLQGSPRLAALAM